MKMFMEKIIEVKKEEIQRKKFLSSLKELERMIGQLPSPRDFVKAISRNGPMALIAEIKHASPSLGTIKEKVDLGEIVSKYEEGGASAISVLTEFHFFKGELSHLCQVKEKTSLPILQKDFVIDPFQIYEGRASGADAILLIATLLDRGQLKDFTDLIQNLHMTPLVEIHDEEDLAKVSDLHLPIIGVNNRDLKTFKVDLQTTHRLKKKIPSGTKIISESGIKSHLDVIFLKEIGVDGILVGEALMRSSDSASKIRELLGKPS
jgi:indole-3-glycerol phosphate synthase